MHGAKVSSTWSTSIQSSYMSSKNPRLVYVITCKFVSKLFSAMQDNQQKIILETKHDENRHSSLPIIVHVSNIWSFNIWSTLLCLNLEGTLKRKKMYTLFLPLLYSYILAIKVFTTLSPRTMHI